MRTAFITLYCLSFAVAASAQTEPGALTRERPPTTVVDPDKDRPSRPQDSFGTQDLAVTNIPMAAFQPRNGASTWSYHGFGYVSRGAGVDLLWAPLTIPNGALIDSVRAWIFDNSPLDMTVFLTEIGGLADFTNDIGSQTSSGTPGATSIAFFPAFTVDNSANSYVIYLNMPIDTNLRAKGVRVLWFRQVSQAPITATFLDVPTNNPLHRFVEALVAAGITGGCGSGNYCPNAPVTRGQMAVFLASALGLHHPF
jgi:hypothetical protein